ncbi:acetyl-CoA carboxylase, carboxyltransferase subunit beta [Pseudoleptotrichia goodfellowii]|uniref:Acetyl-coenzyme A carboxylase carboxyl transferase subunit beta n=2 Tax=Pseudoleptotrichia goodfellowii TaxID=157692 RepID=D0GKY2_9FUSO|nr:acetyl-CoA carboxylase, carboxyltransferase subunit beta [Pseudoleptotrichia goodfellowii]EEY35257.1 acetyl-CoA carboxylase, carboxyl transferase, beta subunit [Pseudoleptotrichia goodfellowii F0264]MBF4806617.1 acetyl-CoA carboxylase carboxyltransferase subunit beta [Pseudoleptotrichia goodfellowii]BBM35846.1 acetyl-CoA carboxylase, carboxyl transferase subunit beta [Pseudoleptotrichia goodfellowii]
MGLFSSKKSKNKYATVTSKSKLTMDVVDDNKWKKCSRCNEIIYNEDLKNNLNICPKCGNYFRLTAFERIELLVDEDTFIEEDMTLNSKDFLKFPGYEEKLENSREKSRMLDGIISGIGKINGIEVSIAAMEFSFMGGSMGSVVGEKVTRALERGIEKKIPVVIVSSSGGARMQEGIVSLMQMAKTSGAVKRLNEAGLPFISVPVDPTTGGVTASFAMLGDIIVTEPNALIAFAGPRVIEQTVNQKLPKGFQRAEFLLEHGMVDVISERKDLKMTIYRILEKLI